MGHPEPTPRGLQIAAHSLPGSHHTFEPQCCQDDAYDALEHLEDGIDQRVLH